jgi:hypothetical protein
MRGIGRLSTWPIWPRMGVNPLRRPPRARDHPNSYPNSLVRDKLIDAAGVLAGGGIPVDSLEYGKVTAFGQYSDVVLGVIWCGAWWHVVW